MVVFLLVMVMIGGAAAVMLSTQEDLAVSGQDREQLTAFYAAEYAVAQARDWLEKQAMTSYLASASNFKPLGWTPVLQALQPVSVLQGCASGPLNLPLAIKPRMNWQDFSAGTSNGAFAAGPGNVMWRFCIHNNSDDLAYIDSANNGGTACNGLTGDTCDARDVLNYITIEAWGAFPVDPASNTVATGAAQAHLAVNVGPPQPRTLTPIGNCSYAVEGGCGAHDGNGGAIDTTNIDTHFVR